MRSIGRSLPELLVLLAVLLPAAVAGSNGQDTATTAPAPSLPASRVLPLPPHTATYEVFRQGTRLGTLEVELTLDNGGVYEFTADTHATHFVARMMGVGASERGRFIWQDDTIRPIYYEQHISRPGPNRYWHANFDWSNQVATGRSHRGPFTTTLTPDTVDPLTQRLELAIRLSGDDGRDAYKFSVIDRDELERQVFLRRGETEVNLPIGCVRAVHFELEEQDPQRGDHSWLAPDMHWLPVRWQQIRDGREVVEVRLRETTLPLDAARCDARSARR